MEAFQARALDLLSEYLQFDSAWWGMSAAAEHGLGLHNSFPYKLPPEFGDLWEFVRHEDCFASMIIKTPGISMYCNTDIFKNLPSMSAFIDRFNIKQVLGTVIADQDLGMKTFLAIYRHGHTPPFNEDERVFKQLAVPHLFSCWGYNRIAQISQLRLSNLDPGFVVATADRKGVLHHASANVIALLREEWPQWKSPFLPPMLMSACQRGNSSFTGGKLSMTLSRAGDWVLLFVKRRRPGDDLSKKERMIAEAYARGESYKEIARNLTLSPATVRHHLRRIYEKLEISDKAQLAQLITA